MTEKRRSRKKDPKSKKTTIPRKERTARAETHRQKLYSTILDYMANTAKQFTDNGNLDIGAWAEDGNVFANKMILDMPQNAELIRTVTIRAAKSLRKSLDMVTSRLKGYSAAIYRHILDATKTEGVSTHPEVNLERFLELVDEWEKGFAFELPEQYRVLTQQAVNTVREGLRKAVFQHDQTAGVENFITQMAEKSTGNPMRRGEIRR